MLVCIYGVGKIVCVNAKARMVANALPLKPSPSPLKFYIEIYQVLFIKL